MYALAIGDLFSVLTALLLYIAPGLAISRFLTKKSGHLARALPITIFAHFTIYEYAHFISIRQSNFVSIAFILVSVGYLMRTASRESIFIGLKELTTHSMSIIVGAGLIVLWLRSSHSLGSIIPNHDAMNHSYMIKNILETGSQQVEDATRLFPPGAGHAGAFYPLGEHSLIAAAVRLTHSSISGQMNVMVFLCAIGIFPYAMTILCEKLFSDQIRLVRIVAPIVSVLLMFTFPFAPLSWGGMAVIIAMSYVPGAAVALVDAVEDRSQKSLFLVAMLLVGLFVMHNTEAITAYLLALVLIFFRSGLTQLRNLVHTTIRIAGIAFIALWSIVPGLVGGAQDRNLDYQGALDPSTTITDYLLRFFVGRPQFAILILIALALVCVPRKVSTTFGLSYIALGALCVIAGRWPSNHWVRAVLKPWYGQVLRINYNIVYIVTPLLLALVISLLGNRSQKRIGSIMGVATLVLLFAFSLRSSITTANDELSNWYKQLVPNSSHSLAAYRFMNDDAKGNAMAMTEADTTSNSTWMYAIAGVRPINATAMTGPNGDAYSAIKSELLRSVGHLKHHPKVLQWVKSKNVQYFYFDENVNLITPNHDTSLEALRSDSELYEVFSSGNAHVFEFRVSN